MHVKSCVRFVLSAALTAVISASGFAQLQITELMFDPQDDTDWEWMEVRNLGGAAVNLNGAFIDELTGGSDRTTPNVTSDAFIPAGGVAVLYDASGLDDTRFRNAWGGLTGVPLVPVETPPSYNNGGDTVGIWANQTAYEADRLAMTFGNALASLDYQMGFPSGNGFASMTWNGMGSNSDGANWGLTADAKGNPISPAFASIQTMLPSTPINNTADIANPGGQTDTGIPPDNSLLITEIMYNPASSESNWEWVEVLNNTGSSIDFSTTPHFIDDSTGELSGPNLSAGIISNGETAILYNGNLELADMQDAWGNSFNYISVDGWQALNNGGDTVGIWDDQTAYDADRLLGTTTLAQAAVAYEDATNGWPDADGAGSIYLNDLGADETLGASWTLSAAMDAIGSYNPAEVLRSVIDNEGGDVGSPGIFGAPPTGNDGDFNGNNEYDCGDVDGLVAEIVAETNNPTYDMDGNMVVNETDLELWRATAGAGADGVPGLTASGNPVQEGDANLDGFVDGQDFFAWNGSKFTETAAWCSGDFNADGFVDGQDFFLWNANKFTAADGAAAVPEPASGVAMLMLLLAAIPIRRRR